ncbi:hypothetical protein [Vibrio metschnikovii]|uniref:Lipoprotein n=1 Tax=Vibrio metschnikovii TaxID=28172 RepID=A0A9X0UII1_VIBME|nr:hypothetical protein [Vibrio metschnikovii]MBC5851885.1 hypothetical protein [Vibrio metschnikovii]
MQKQIITSAIALTLFGCGGGESGNSGNPAPPVKNFNVNFLGLKVQSNETNCQIFGYNSEESQKVIAFNSRPDSVYEIILHNPDGSVHKKYNNFSTTSFSFKQNEVPNNGYVSFAEFNRTGINHVTTFAKELLPESLNIYAKGSATNNCLTPNSANPNIQMQEGYINPRRALDYYTGFNTAYQKLNNFTEHYNLTKNGNIKIEFPSQQRPLLAVQYATNEDGSELNQLIGFKFTPFTQRGSTATPLELTEVTNTNAPWNTPNDLTLDSVNLFVDGRQFNAPYAYLWQPLSTTQTGQFSYSDHIVDTNYYLNIKGKQTIGGQVNVWGVQHVAQGTTNTGTSLNADNILVDFPFPEAPRLTSCQTDSQKQCLHITSNHLPNHTIQRIFIRVKLNSGDQSVRQVFYTPSQNELPLMEFGSPGIDGQFNDLLSASTSFMQTTQSSIKEAFLYQNQDLFGMIFDFPTQNTNPRVDGIPLLKNIAAQQDQQDLLKRQPYTWVWLEE